LQIRYFLKYLFVGILFTNISTIYAQDTTAVTERDTSISINKDDGLKDPVDYNAEDSIFYDLVQQKAFLWGKSSLKMGNFELTAGYIEVDFKEQKIYAHGIKDSLGNETQLPKYKEGSEEFTANEVIYDYKTRKGTVRGVRTEQADGFLFAEQAKMHENNEYHFANGRYTTCNDPNHPHYYIQMTKAKVVNNSKIISGPFYFVVEGVPLPIGLPFGFFPSKQRRSAGILTPGYGEEAQRGFFLKNIGYYIPISDYVDLALSGDIYSYGSWAMKATSKYKYRYHYNGNLMLSFNKNVVGEEGLSNYNVRKDFKIRWTHSQDAKANPSRTLSANVDFGSSSYNKYNEQNIGDFLKNTKSSSINYTKRFLGTPFTFSANIKGTQNTSTSNVDFSLPLLTLTMARQYPFKKLIKVPKGRWYEKIGVSYSSSLSNTLSTIDTLLFTPSTLTKFRNGFQQSIPVSTSFNLLKYFNVGPSFNYKGRIYTNSIRKYWKDELFFNTADSTYEYGHLVNDTINGIKHVYDWSVSIPISTKLYGMFYFKRLKRIEAIRHVLTPSVGFSFRPDFGEKKYGYYDTYYENADDTVPNRYSYFDNGIYGTAPYGKSGNINFSLGNNFEMKLKSKKDTTEEGFKKIKLLDRLNFNGSYNLAADSLNLSDISMSGATRLFNMFTINFSAVFNPYSYDDSTGVKINKFMWNEHQKLARFSNARVSTGINLNSKTLFKGKTEGKTEGKNENQNQNQEENDYYDLGYVDFSLPWNIRADYSLSVSKSSYDVETKEFVSRITQTIRYSGSFKLTDKWNVSFTSGYDLQLRKASTTSINVTRDLHCWQMSFRWVPFGVRKSYMFRVNLKSSILEGLEFKRQETWFDNLR